MRRSRLRWPARLRCVPVVLALIAGVLALGAGPASAAPAEGSFVKCNDEGPTSAVYVIVGGAPLHVAHWQNFGYNGSGEPAAPSTSTIACASLPDAPKDGTFVRGTVANADNTAAKLTGSTYEIVGGAPVTVHAWANLGTSSKTPKKVDVEVLGQLTAPNATCTSGYAGCLTSRPAANTVIAGYSKTAKKPTTFYRVDSVGHPVPLRAAVSGALTVDQTSINACERMNCNPDGTIVDAYGAGYGVLHVDGAAQDYPSSASVSVRITAGASSFVIPANRPTTYVPASTAGNHGFAADLPVPAGVYVMCGTVLGTAPGAATQPLGCSNVTVPGAKPGKVHRPKVKAKGHRRLVVKWKRADTNGSPISAYIIKTTAKKKKKQVSGSVHKVVIKHLPAGHRVKVKVRAINAVGLGAYSKPSKARRVH